MVTVSESTAAYNAARAAAKKAARRAYLAGGRSYGRLMAMQMAARMGIKAPYGSASFWRQYAAALKSQAKAYRANPPIRGKDVPDAIKQYADRYGMSVAAAVDTIERYQSDPKAAEFANLTDIQRRDLGRLQGDVRSPMSQWAYEQVKDYIKPGVITPTSGGRDIGRKFDLDAAVKAGVTDLAIYRLASRQIGFHIKQADINAAQGRIKAKEVIGDRDIFQAIGDKVPQKHLEALYTKDSIRDAEKSLRQMQRQNPGLYRVYTKQGAEAGEKAAKRMQEQVKAHNQRLSQDMALLSKFKKGDGYRLDRALAEAQGNPKLMAAIKRNFEPDDIERINIKIAKSEKIAETQARVRAIAKKRERLLAGQPPVQKMPEATAKVTPARIYAKPDKDRLTKEIEKFGNKYNIPTKLLSAIVVASPGAAMEPTPIGEVTLGVLLGVGAIYGTWTAGKELRKAYDAKFKETPADIQKHIKEGVPPYRGELARAEEYILPTPAMQQRMEEFDLPTPKTPEALKGIMERQEEIIAKKNAFVPAGGIHWDYRLPSDAMTELDVGGHIVKIPKDPNRMPEAVRRITGQYIASDVIISAVEAENAGRELKKQLRPLVTELPITRENYERLWDDIENAIRKGRQERYAKASALVEEARRNEARIREIIGILIVIRYGPVHGT